MKPVSLIDTITVYSKQNKKRMVINEKDFDPNIHDKNKPKNTQNQNSQVKKEVDKDA